MGDEHRQRSTIDSVEFERALWLGLGRAVVLLRAAGGGATFREAVLRACRRDDRYDRQCENTREQFLFDLIAATGEPEFYWRWLFRATAPWRLRGDGGEQLVALLRVFAAAGDGEAWTQLYTIFTANVAINRPDAAAEIVELDGLVGLLFVVPHLVVDDDDPWFVSYLIGLAAERDGEAATWTALESAADATSAVARLLALVWADEEDGRVRRERDAENAVIALDYPAIRARLLAGERGARNLLWRWARGATDAEMVIVATDLLTDLLREENPQHRNAYLRIFRERRFPLDHAPLLALARHRSRRTAAPAIGVLAKIAHDDVRALALELLAVGQGDGARLLAANYREGDYALVEQCLRSWHDREAVHALGFGLRDMVEANPRSEAKAALLALYALGPCSNCRHHTVELLAGLGPLPLWLIEECRWDANLELRKTIQEYAAALTGDLAKESSL